MPRRPILNRRQPPPLPTIAPRIPRAPPPPAPVAASPVRRSIRLATAGSSPPRQRPEQTALEYGRSLPDKTYFSAWLITLNTNRVESDPAIASWALSHRTRDTYLRRVAMKVFRDSLMWRNAKMPKAPLAPGFTWKDFFEGGGDSEFNAFRVGGERAVTIYGTPEIGPRRNRVHVHYVLVFKHKSFCALDYTDASAAAKAMGIPHCDIKPIRDLSLLFAIAYASKSESDSIVDRVLNKSA